MRRAALLVGFSPLALGCVFAPRTTYVPPGPSTVFVETDERQKDPPMHIVSIVNQSSEHVFVWSMSLNQCENIKQACEARPVEVHLPPKGRHVAMRVEPASSEYRFSYRFSFAWRAESGTNTTVRVASPSP